MSSIKQGPATEAGRCLVQFVNDALLMFARHWLQMRQMNDSIGLDFAEIVPSMRCSTVPELRHPFFNCIKLITYEARDLANIPHPEFEI
jgi:hypothetical protein